MAQSLISDNNGFNVFSSKPATGAAGDAIDDNFRRLSKYWGPFVNVRSFGAAGDGTTDDTSAIQDAIDSLLTERTGAALLFPPGSYKVTDTLLFDNHTGLRVIGSGARRPPPLAGTPTTWGQSSSRAG